MIAAKRKLFISFPHLALSTTSRCKTLRLLTRLVLHLVLLFLIRVLTTLAHLYNPGTSVQAWRI